MKLWLITPTDDDGTHYDICRSAVVAAETEEKALKAVKNSFEEHPCKIEYIGDAAKHIEQGCLCMDWVAP